jgi:hypothetical protein
VVWTGVEPRQELNECSVFGGSGSLTGGGDVHGSGLIPGRGWPKRTRSKRFSQPSAHHITIHYVFSQHVWCHLKKHVWCPHHCPLKLSIYFFYRFSMTNNIHVCNALFAVECCDAITFVYILNFIFEIY